MPLLEVYRRDNLDWSYPLAGPEIRIGRSKNNDIVLLDPAVSRLHATIRCEAERCVLEDRSTNGTLVNQLKVDSTVLTHGDRIGIADYTLVFSSETAAGKSPGQEEVHEANTLIIRSYDSRSNELAVEKGSLVLDHHGEERRFPIGKERLTIGAAADNDIRIADPSVSPHHAVLEYQGGRFTLIALGQAGVTRIQERPVSRTVLQGGTTIEFGRVRARFVCTSQRQPLPVRGDTAFAGMVGHSLEMRRVYALIERISKSNLPVLVLGETGTGKELIALALHALSGRASGPLVTINCGAVARNLIESELFGHRKGAFTGADTDRQGAFERADGGTLFLDEIGELPIDLQPKLLRVLEDKTVTRVGDNQTRPTDFRLVAATNRVLSEEVKNGRFREDLFYRISVVPLSLPPLRSRKEDIPLLTEHFLSGVNRQAGSGTTPVRISESAKNKLLRHHWPGNVRELKNAIERAALMSDKDRIEAEDLNFIPLGKEETEEIVERGELSLEEAEKRLILRTLQAQQGNKRSTAKVLGVAYSTLWAKMKKYNIPLALGRGLA